jgi:hypothetical protein
MPFVVPDIEREVWYDPEEGIEEIYLHPEQSLKIEKALQEIYKKTEET